MSRNPFLDPETEEYQNAPYYCPACGERSNLERVCQGNCAARPSPRFNSPVAFVSTDELNGAPEEHTAAPASE